jgi:uncharacterized membrane protein
MEEAMRDLEVYAGAALLGVLAGMRSMAAPAVIGQLSRNGANVSKFLAVGEIIADNYRSQPIVRTLAPYLEELSPVA